MPFVDWNQVPPIQLGPGVRIRAPFGTRLMISLVELDSDAVVPPHAHPHEQAGMVLEGKMELAIGGESKVLAKGDAYFIPGGTTHSARSVGGPCRALDIFSPVRDDYARGVNEFIATE